MTPASVMAAAPERDIPAYVETLRSFAPTQDGKALDRFSEKMDEAWQSQKKDLKASLPVLRTQLSSELARPRPSSFVLLDIGYFLLLHDEESRTLAHDALFQIDIADPVIKLNGDQLFRFTHQIAALRDPRTLAWIDKAFLRNPMRVSVPQHYMILGPEMVSTLLYGVYGEGAEAHLLTMVGDPGVRPTVLSVLSWIGTKASIGPVITSVSTDDSEGNLSSIATTLALLGGPEGRAALLGLDPAKLGPGARASLEKMRPRLTALGYEGLKTAFDKMPGLASVPDADLLARLAKMRENHGHDDELSPRAVLASTLPAATLISELETIRTATLHRVSDEALDDVTVTNRLIAALRYRP